MNKILLFSLFISVIGFFSNAQLQKPQGIEKDLDTVYIIPVVFHILHEYGSENISDAQVFDQMAILNRDYRKLNADTTDIVSEFQAIATDAHIEFRLATLDPNGNPTSGIEHIFTPLTNNADDDSKINEWPPEKYLNIWTVRTVNNGDVAGYTYLPSQIDSNNCLLDGIILQHDFIGSIGTGAPHSSRALTHEVGHYLGLRHLHGGAEIGICGDDGIADTPITEGSSSCQLNDDSCNPGIIENVQNFMEFSYCLRMFTLGQVEHMRNVLNSSIIGRNNLISLSNLMETGVFDTTITVNLPPISDFSFSDRNICEGATIQFSDASWQAPVTIYSWSFPTGTPATSIDENPIVTYATEGFKSFTLTVTNSYGSSTKTITNGIYVSPLWAAFAGPYSETFDNPAVYWFGQNPNENSPEFVLAQNEGVDLSTCWKLNNFPDSVVSNSCGITGLYQAQLGGSKDYIISAPYDLANTTGITISFDYAYASGASVLSDITEKLKVYSSRDCGETWLSRTTVQDEDLVTVSYPENTDFVPANNLQWKTTSFNYISNSNDGHTRFRFEFTASDFSNNLFIDNFNVDGILGIIENGQLPIQLTIAPNPVTSGGAIEVEVQSSNEEMLLELIDVNGIVLSSDKLTPTGESDTISIPITVAKGIYFLKAQQGNRVVTHRVVVM